MPGSKGAPPWRAARSSACHEPAMPLGSARAVVGVERLRVRVRGAVQGVGFRPFVHGLAQRYGLSGFVLNDQDGVLAEIEGDAHDLFLSALRRERPVLARI